VVGRLPWIRRSCRARVPERDAFVESAGPDVSRQTISRDFPEGFSGPFEPPIGLRLAFPACMDLGSMVERVRGEFNEMPGLQLTEAQAARLWGLEPGACRRVVKELVDSEFLRWTPSGRITLAQR
jgi:hypothetical protein